METYDVRIYPAAKRDLVEIIQYLNTLSPDAALRYYDLLSEKIQSLSHMPERCPPEKDNILRARGYRCMAVNHYLVFYIIVGRVVQIRRIVYGKRNYESLL